LPPAGTDTFGANAQVSITSRLGSETISFIGTVTIDRQAPHDDGGVEVEDLAITALDLHGLSATGNVSLSQSPSVASTGELRSLQQNSQFPASSFFDINVDAQVPSSGSYTNPPFYVHNETPLHLVPMSNGSEVHLDSWPSLGVKYGQHPAPCIRMLRNVLDPRTQDPWAPAEICVTDISVTLGPPPTPMPTSTPCSGTCPPTATPTEGPATGTRTPRPSATPTRTPTPFGPENPTFSVARGGPSGLHPAALLRIGQGGAPLPIAVTGNDNFASAWPIDLLPFAGIENTLNFTTEVGEPLNPGGCITTPPSVKGATAWFRFTAPATGSMNIDTNGGSIDTVLAVYTGSSVGALSPRACDDDSGEGRQSLIQDLAVTSGTTYYIQVGGFDAGTGPIHLNLTAPSGAGAGTASVTVAISCTALGLTTDGCDDGSDGDQDDIDALSFGDDTMANANPIAFSVAPGSQGVAASGVAAQAACSPPEPQADEFTSGRNGTNTLVLDGDSQGSGCPGGFGFGLNERPASDNLDALDGHPPNFVDENGDGVLDLPVYFALAPNSPSLAALAATSADIFWTIGFTPGVYASASNLGLQPTDDIDGLCLVDRGQTAHYDPGVDSILFSLKAGSPTLAAIGASAADVLAPGPSVRYRAAELGLQASDDLDAMKCFQTSGPSTVKVPVGDNWYCDPSHANGNVCETKVNVGDIVEWNWVGTAPHSVTACGASCNQPAGSPLFDSGVMTQGGHFEFSFNTPGTYLYYCTVHGPGQIGRIVVSAAGGSTPTQTAVPTPTRTPIPPTPAGRPGDSNCSGAVDSIDAALVLQLSAGLIHTLPCPQNGDVNSDGRTNSIDASLILQFVAGLLPHLPP